LSLNETIIEDYDTALKLLAETYLETEMDRKEFYLLDKDETYHPVDSAIDHFILESEETRLVKKFQFFKENYGPRVAFAVSLIEKYYIAEFGIIGEFSPRFTDNDGIARSKDRIDLLYECKALLKEAVSLYQEVR
jgi:hypothetical protein